MSIPDWLQKSLQQDQDREIHEAPDGTFTVCWFLYESVIPPVYGIPTRELAESINDALNAARDYVSMP